MSSSVRMSAGVHKGKVVEMSTSRSVYSGGVHKARGQVSLLHC